MKPQATSYKLSCYKVHRVCVVYKARLVLSGNLVLLCLTQLDKNLTITLVMDHANPLPSSLGMESAQKPQRSFLLRYFLALVMPFLITMGLVLAYSQYATQLRAGVSSVQSKKIIRVDDVTFGLSAIGSEEEYRDILMHLTPTPRIVADTLSSSEADLRAPAARDPFAPAIIDLQKSLLPTPAKLLADGSTLYASQNGKTYVLTSTSGKDPRQASIIPEGGTLLSSPDKLFILSAEAPGSSRLSAYQTKDPTKPTKLWTLTTSQTSRIGFSTLYKDELVLGISSSLTTDLPCAMTVATIDDKPVEVDCATILYPTTPFVPDSVMTLLKIQLNTAQVTSSFSSFVRKNTVESIYTGVDSLYLAYPLSTRTGIAQISLADLSLTDSLQVPGTLTRHSALHEFGTGKLVVVTDSDVLSNWHLVAPYPGTSSVIPEGSFQKTVSRQSVYAMKNHLYIPPTKHGESYQIIDFATNPNTTIAGSIEIAEKNTQLFPIENSTHLMVGLMGDDTKVTVLDLTSPEKPVKKSSTLYEKSKAGIGTILSRIVVNNTSHVFYMHDQGAGYLFSYSTTGTFKLLKTLPNYSSDDAVMIGSIMYSLTDGSIESLNLGNYTTNKVQSLN